MSEPHITPEMLAPKKAAPAVMAGKGAAYAHDPFGLGETPPALIKTIRRMRHRSIGALAWAIFFRVSLVCMGAYLAALLFDRSVPTRTTVEIAHQVDGPGRDLGIEVTPNLLRRCEGRVTFEARDRLGNLVHQSDTAWNFSSSAIGPDKVFKRKLRISRDAVASEDALGGGLKRDAFLRIKREYYCNPVQKMLGWPIIDIMPDRDFAIAPEPVR